MKPADQRLIAWAKRNIGQAPSGEVGALTLPDDAAEYLRIANAEVRRAREKLPLLFNDLMKYEAVVRPSPRRRSPI